MVAPGAHEPPDMESALAAVDDLVAEGAPLSSAVREVAEATTISRRTLYENALEARRIRDE